MLCLSFWSARYQSGIWQDFSESLPEVHLDDEGIAIKIEMAAKMLPQNHCCYGFHESLCKYADDIHTAQHFATEAGCKLAKLAVDGENIDEYLNDMSYIDVQYANSIENIILHCKEAI